MYPLLVTSEFSDAIAHPGPLRDLCENVSQLVSILVSH